MGEFAKSVTRKKFNALRGEINDGTRHLVIETPIAIVVNGTTHAVMMASPCDLREFAFGFALCEGIIERADEVEIFEILQHEKGIELRIRLVAESSAKFQRNRNLRMGPVGCGLCGVDSIDAIFQNQSPIENANKFSPQIIVAAMSKLRDFQPANQLTHAIHAAAYIDKNGEFNACFEDIGRHNALDKLIGHILLNGIAASEGAILLSSRISIDLVQKCARIGCGNLAAVSAPSDLAIERAKAMNINIFAIVRNDGLEMF